MTIFKKISILALLLAAISFDTAWAANKIQSVIVKNTNNGPQFQIGFQEGDSLIPEITTRENILQFSFKPATIWPRVEKTVQLDGYSVQLMAYQFDKDTVRVRAIFPKILESNTLERVKAAQSGQMINIDLLKSTTVTSGTKKAEQFDEEFLTKLEAVNAGPGTINNNVQNKTTNEKVTDFLKTTSASGVKKSQTTKKNSNTFNLASYVLKFTAFLALVLVLFYGVVTFFKKGMRRNGKLGLITAKDSVVVLSNTYVAPKRSLMLIKAHNQVLLVSNTESGISLLTEIKDTATLFKDGEKEISGENFDTELDRGNTKEKEFKLKSYDEINQSKESEEGDRPSNLSQFLQENPIKDEVKISDKIKKKVKGLRAIQ